MPASGGTVLTATGCLSVLRPHYAGETRDLLRVLLNATSPTEANLALEVLRATMHEKALVQACNLREVLRSLPTSPFAMRVDEETLVRAIGFERRMAAMGKRLDDDIELAITTAGNLVLDVIVRLEDEKYFWNPIPVTDDFVHDDVLDIVVQSDHLLPAMIEMTTAMGVVLNPKFYLSLEDWRLEYAQDVFDSIRDLF